VLKVAADHVMTSFARSLDGADKIAHRAQQLALDAGIGKIGVTWDEGSRFAPDGPHTLNMFRGDAESTAKFSDDEVQTYPDGPQRARTEAKLAAMVRQMARHMRYP
jgi:hypothetical protein